MGGSGGSITQTAKRNHNSGENIRGTGNPPYLFVTVDAKFCANSVQGPWTQRQPGTSIAANVLAAVVTEASASVTNVFATEAVPVTTGIITYFVELVRLEEKAGEEKGKRRRHI